MIDWKRVEELREEIGADDFAEVVGMFLDEAHQTIDRLRGGIPPEVVGGQLHFLKGSALNLGLTELAALCQTGEQEAARGRAEGVDLMRVVDVYLASEMAFLGAMASDSAA
ncbi:MAG: hypothetical protein HC844_09730 [Tabrizicola sp.]|nr:hypothetical protein [Tabrizicola sp.]